MHLSVTHRIGGGFALLVLLLLVISTTSYRSLDAVDTQFQRTTGEIAPIATHSADIAVALLSANKALMQFMSSQNEETLSAQEDALNTQQASYDTQREALLNLGKQYQQVSEAISIIDPQASEFFSSSQQAMSSHRQYLSLGAEVKQLESDLLDELKFFTVDINDLTEYGENLAERNAGPILTSNLQTVTGDIGRLLKSEDLSVIKPLESSFNITGYGLKAMQDRLEKLKASGSSSADNLLETLAIIQQATTAPDGVVQVHKKRVELKLQIAALLEQISATINSTNDTVNQLRADSQALADAATLDARETVSLSQTASIIISAASVIIAIIIAIWVSHNIRTPLSRVMSILKTIADGDLSQRLSITSKDEFGQLSQWVNDLASKQESIIRDIQSASGEISESAREAATISDRTNQLMDEQNQHTTQVATAIHQMSAAAEEVAQSAEQAQQQVTAIDQTAGENRALMQQNITVVNGLASEIDRASAVITQLNEDSANIGQILEVIDGIAGQTNLLALNAAIEAARAGEQGRGFAVVADEVRNLASRTKDSTEDIQAMIDKLQTRAKEAVTIMESSRQEAQSSVDQTEQAQHSLENMVGQLSEIRNMSEHIAVAAEEQTSVSQEISASVQRIADMAEQGAHDARQTARGSEALSGLAERQQKLTSVFNLG